MARKVMLYIGADSDIEATLTRNDTGAAITTGTATFAVKKTSDDSTVTNGSGSLTHVSAGLWRGTLGASASLALATDYYVEIDFDSSGLEDYRRIPAVAKYRAET